MPLIRQVIRTAEVVRMLNSTYEEGNNDDLLDGFKDLRSLETPRMMISGAFEEIPAGS